MVLVRHLHVALEHIRIVLSPTAVPYADASQSFPADLYSLHSEEELLRKELESIKYDDVELMYKKAKKRRKEEEKNQQETVALVQNDIQPSDIGGKNQK